MATLFFLPSQDSYVTAQAPDTNFGGSQELIAGLTSKNLLQAFIQFDLSTLPHDICITDASMKLFLLADSAPAVAKEVAVFPVIQTWRENELNFLNQPGFATTPVDAVIIKGEVETFFTWNMSNVVQDWHSGAIENNGIVLRTVFEPITFASSEALYTTTRIRPLLTVQYQPAVFVNELQQDLATTDVFQNALIHNVSGLQEVSFFISNTGTNDVDVQLESSPDASTFLDEGPPVLLPAGENTLMVPRFFIQYVRVRYKSANSGAPSTVNIWFQGQGR